MSRYPRVAERDTPGEMAALLKQANRWRTVLATDLAARHAETDGDGPDSLVSCTIEGIVFLRLCEDRGLEPRGQLRALQDAGDVHRRLVERFYQADQRYCRGRPHFAPPAHSSGGSARLDDARLKQIIAALCLSAESALPAELLGRVHEQSIATRIQVTPAGGVTVGRNRSARKARGVYYTPPRLIEHVLQHALGRPCDGRPWPPRILDPSCGAGAFLLGAYQYLLDWHPSGQPNLAERQRILLDSIFGVDIDPRAVETTRLTLLLRLFEGDAANRHKDPLPDLTNNIHCGNALLSPGFTEQPDEPVRACDWPAAFPTAFARDNPGFDAVIGNPPWGQKEIRKDPRLIAHLRAKFPSTRGIFDLFRPFVEQAVRLCREAGTVGLVLPDIVLLKNYQATRRFLLENLTLTALDWWGLRFGGAMIDAATIVGIKHAAPAGHCVQVGIHDRETERSYPLPQSHFWSNERHTFNLHLTPDKRRILRGLRRFPRLGEFFEAHEGVHSGNLRAELFVVTPLDRSCRPLLFGRDEITPYHLRWRGRYLRLSAAPGGRTPQHYAHIGRPEWFARDKLLVRRTGDHIVAAVDAEGRYASNNFFLVFPCRPGPLTLDGLCALLNSAFMTWYFRTIEPRQGRVFAELKIKHLATFPLPDPRQAGKTCQTLNELGRRRAVLASQLADAASPQTAEPIQAACTELDTRIATLVREVFGVDGHCQ